MDQQQQQAQFNKKYVQFKVLYRFVLELYSPLISFCHKPNVLTDTKLASAIFLVISNILNNEFQTVENENLSLNSAGCSYEQLKDQVEKKEFLYDHIFNKKTCVISDCNNHDHDHKTCYQNIIEVAKNMLHLAKIQQDLVTKYSI